MRKVVSNTTPLIAWAGHDLITTMTRLVAVM